jgi:hypothetical protein
MTPDELPADMEKRLAEFADWLRPGGTEPCAYTSARIGTDLRALLKAYQERGRALEAAAPVVPAPEGEAVKSYGQKGRALYEAFWARNGDASPPPWDEQAHAIRAMWVNIARDAEPLYASPVVPAPEGEACWPHSYKADAAGQAIRCVDCGMSIASEASPVVPVGVSEVLRPRSLIILLALAGVISLWWL